MATLNEFLTGVPSLSSIFTGEDTTDINNVKIDPIEEKIQEKTARIDAKNSRFGVLADYRSPDADNLNKGYGENTESNRLASSQGSFDAWEVPHSESFYTDPKYGSERIAKLTQQRLLLDQQRGLPLGTSTVQDVFDMGLQAKDAMTSLLDAESIKNPDAQIEFRDKNVRDKSGHNRTITQAFVNGSNIADKLVNTEFNANRDTTYNIENRLKDLSIFAPKDREGRYSDLELANSNWKYAKHLGKRAIAGLGNIAYDQVQGAIGAIARPFERVHSEKDQFSFNQLKQIEADPNREIPDYLKKFKAGQDYENPEYDRYKEQQKSSKNANLSLSSILSKAVEKANPLSNFKAPLTELADKAVKFEGKTAYEDLSNANKFREFQKSIDRTNKATKYRQEKINTNYDEFKHLETKYGSGETFKDTAKKAKEFIKSPSWKKAINTASSALKGSKEFVSEVADPRYMMNNIADSAGEMAVIMATKGTSAIGTAASLKDKFDRKYKENHKGISAKGQDAIKQDLYAAGIALSQVGGAEAMVGGLLKKAGIGLKKVPVKGPAGTYKTYIPYNLSKKYKPAEKAVSLSAKDVEVLDKVLDPKILGIKFSSNPAWNKAAAKAGMPVGKFIKASLMGSWALAKNAKRVAKAGSEEYVQEFSEELMTQLGESIGTDKHLDFLKAHIAGTAGFAAGAGIRGAIVAPRTLTETSKATLEGAGAKFGTQSTYMDGQPVVKGSRASQIEQEILRSAKTDNFGEAVTKSPIIKEVIKRPAENIDIVPTIHSKIENEMLSIMSKLDNREVKSKEEGMKLIARLGDLGAIKNDIEQSQINSIKQAQKSYKEKDPEQYDDKDLADELLDAEELHKLSLDKTRGEISQEAKAIIKKIKNQANSLDSGTYKTAKEVLDNKKKNNLGNMSLRGHMNQIKKHLDMGNYELAERSISKLNRFAKIHDTKMKKFREAVSKGEGITWGRGKNKSEYDPESAKKVYKQIKAEAKVLGLYTDLARYSLESYKKREARKNELKGAEKVIKSFSKKTRKFDTLSQEELAKRFGIDITNDTNSTTTTDSDTDISPDSTDSATGSSDVNEELSGKSGKTKPTFDSISNEELEKRFGKSATGSSTETTTEKDTVTETPTTIITENKPLVFGSKDKQTNKLKIMEKLAQKEAITHYIGSDKNDTTQKIKEANPNHSAFNTDTIDRNSVVMFDIPRSIESNKSHKDLVAVQEEVESKLKEVIKQKPKVIHTVKGGTHNSPDLKNNKDRKAYLVKNNIPSILKKAGYEKSGKNTWVYKAQNSDSKGSESSEVSSSTEDGKSSQNPKISVESQKNRKKLNRDKVEELSSDIVAIAELYDDITYIKEDLARIFDNVVEEFKDSDATSEDYALVNKVYDEVSKLDKNLAEKFKNKIEKIQKQETNEEKNEYTNNESNKPDKKKKTFNTISDEELANRFGSDVTETDTETDTNKKPEDKVNDGSVISVPKQNDPKNDSELIDVPFEVIGALQKIKPGTIISINLNKITDKIKEKIDNYPSNDNVTNYLTDIFYDIYNKSLPLAEQFLQKFKDNIKEDKYKEISKEIENAKKSKEKEIEEQLQKDKENRDVKTENKSKRTKFKKIELVEGVTKKKLTEHNVSTLYADEDINSDEEVSGDNTSVIEESMYDDTYKPDLSSFDLAKESIKKRYSDFKTSFSEVVVERVGKIKESTFNVSSLLEGSLDPRIRGSKQVIARRNKQLESFKKAKITDTNELALWLDQFDYGDISTKHMVTAINKFLKRLDFNVPVTLKKITYKDGKFYDENGTRVKSEEVNHVFSGNKGIVLTYIEGTDTMQSFSLKSVIHEYAHVATSLSLRNKNNKDIVKEIQRLIDIVKKDENWTTNKNNKIPYGLTNPREFIAELTNPTFRTLLAKSKDPKAKGKKPKGILGIAINLYQRLAKRFARENFVEESVLVSALDLLHSKLLDNVIEDTNIEVEATFAKQVLGLDQDEKIGLKKALENNLQIRKTKTDNLFAVLPNVFTDNLDKLIKSLNLSDYEAEIFRNIAEFSSDIRDILIEDVLEDTSDMGNTGRLKVAEISPIHYLMGNDGKPENIADNWYGSIGVTLMNWLGQEAKQTLYQNAKQIRKNLNLTETEGLPWEFVQEMSTKGIPLAVLAQSLGMKVLKQMNVAEKQNATDAELYDRLAVSIGESMLLAAQKAGYVEIQGIRNSVTDAVLPERKRSNNPKAYTLYVKAVGGVNKEGITYFKDKMREFHEEYKSYHYPELSKEFFEPDTAHKRELATEEPTEKSIKKRIKGSFMRVSDAMHKGMLNLSKKPWEPNIERITAWTNLDEDIQKKVLGYQNAEEFHPYFHDGINGKNQTIDNDLDNFYSFLEDYEGKLPDKVYMVQTMWKNMRQGYESNQINIQASKFHRAMFNAKDWRDIFNLNNKEDMALFNKAIEHITGKKATEFVDKNGNFNDEIIGKAAQIFDSSKKPTREEQEALEGALDKIGEGMHGYTVLETLYNYSDALKNKKETFTVSSYVEPDGATNGTIISAIQTVTNPNSERFLKTTMAGGLFTNDVPFKSLGEYLKDNPDNYQNLILEVAKSAGMLDRSSEMEQIFDKLDSLLMPPLFKGTKVTKEGRNFAKPFVMTYVYAKGEASMKQDAVDSFEEALYTYIQKHREDKEALLELNKTMVQFAALFNEEMGLDIDVDFEKEILSGDIDKIIYDKKALEDLFEEDINQTKGNLITESLEYIYEDLKKSRDIITEAMRNAYKIGKAILEKEIELAEIAKAEALKEQATGFKGDRASLNKLEYRTLIDNIIKEGKLPTLKHASSKGYEDSILIQSKEHTAYGEKVKTRINPTEITIYESFGEDAETSKEVLEVVSGRAYKTVFSSDISVKPFVIPILSFDGNIQNKVLGHLTKETGGNIHDAILWGFRHYEKNTDITNQVFLDQHKQYDLMKESLDTVQRMENLRKEYSEKYGDSMFKELSMKKKRGKKGKGKGFTFVKNKKDKGEDKDYFESLKDLEKATEVHLKAKEEYLNNIRYVGQFDSGKALKIKDIEAEDKIEFDDVKDEKLYNSHPDPLNINIFNTVASQVLNESNLVPTFYQLRKVDNQTGADISDTHSEYLFDFMNTFGKSIFKTVDKLNMKILRKGRENKAAIKDATVFINAARRKTGRNSMSAQEAYAHEITHGIFHYGLNNEKEFKARLYDIYLDVMNSPKRPTYKIFLEPGRLVSKAEKKAAKELFEYIFDNKRTLEEFAAYGLTNEKVKYALMAIPTRRINKVEGKNLTPFQRLTNLFSDLVHKFTFEKTAYDDLVRLVKYQTKVSNDFALDARAINPFSEDANKYAADLLAEKIVAPLNKLFREKPVIFQSKNEAIQKATALPRAIWSTTSAVVAAYSDPAVAQEYRNIAKDFHKQIGKFFSALATEARGTTIRNMNFHRILRYSKHYTDSVFQQVSNTTKNQIRNAFNQDLSKQDWKDLTKAILDTDFGSLLEHFNEVDIEMLLTDKMFRDSIISSIERKIRREDKSAELKLTYTKALGIYMVTKKSPIKELQTNAHRIADLEAYGLKKEDRIKGEDLKQQIRDIDILATLYALKEVNQDTLDNVKRIYIAEKKENEFDNGVLNLAEMANITRKRQIENVYMGDHYASVKGEYRRNIDPNIHIVYVSGKRVNAYKKKGYKVIQTIQNKGQKKTYIMESRENIHNRYVSGMVNLTRNSRESSKIDGRLRSFVTIKSMKKHKYKLDRNANYPIPINTLDEEQMYEIPQELYENEYGGEMDASVIVGDTMGLATITTDVYKYNSQTVKELYSDYQKYYLNDINNSRDGFIKFNSDSHPETWNILPEHFKDELIEIFHGEENIYINEDYFDLIFGFRKKSISNLFNKNEQARKLFFHAEKIWQSIVGRAKTSVVIYTPKVLIANVVSNTILSIVKGVPPTYIWRYQTKALQELSKYRRIVDRKHEIELKLQTDRYKNNKNLKKSLARLTAAIENNPITPLIDEGLFTTYVEEIEDASNHLVESIDNAYVSLVPKGKPNKLKGLIEGGSNKLPKLIPEMYKNSVIAPDTNLAKDLRYATQVSDFVARYAMYRYRIDKLKVSHDDAILEVVETFVSYDYNTSAEMQWINDMGILMYTKFLFRIQKVLYKMFRERPINATASLAAQAAFGQNVPDIADSFLFTALSPARFSNPAELVDQAFELNLLHYLDWMWR